MGEGFPFEPEGFLSTFPSIANVVAGYLVGSYVQKKGNSFEGLAKLFMAGFVCFIIAYWWNFGFPINKKLWTSSFVLHTVGLDCMILACIIYWIGFLNKTKGVYFFHKIFSLMPVLILVRYCLRLLICYFAGVWDIFWIRERFM